MQRDDLKAYADMVRKICESGATIVDVSEPGETFEQFTARMIQQGELCAS